MNLVFEANHCEVWCQEIKNWECFLYCTYSVIITGSQFKITFITFMSVISDASLSFREDGHDFKLAKFLICHLQMR